MVLSSIRISNCPSLQRINITSKSLQVCHNQPVILVLNILLSDLFRECIPVILYVQQLVLQKQESLTALELHCECLQEVDLTDCESLTNSIFEVFSDGGGCPMLKSLVLDNCEVSDLLLMLIHYDYN